MAEIENTQSAELQMKKILIHSALQALASGGFSILRNTPERVDAPPRPDLMEPRWTMRERRMMLLGEFAPKEFRTTWTS